MINDKYAFSLMKNASLNQIEKFLIQERMIRFENKKIDVANSLGITLKTLYNKLNQYELNPAKTPDYEISD